MAVRGVGSAGSPNRDLLSPLEIAFSWAGSKEGDQGTDGVTEEAWGSQESPLQGGAG